MVLTTNPNCMSVYARVGLCASVQFNKELQQMLADTYTLGTAGNQLIFDKLYGTPSDGSKYSVSGLATDESKSLTVQSQLDKAKAKRTLIDFRVNIPVPDTTSGAFGTLRNYVNFVVPSFVDRADVLAACERTAALLSDTAIMNDILDGML